MRRVARIATIEMHRAASLFTGDGNHVIEQDTGVTLATLRIYGAEIIDVK